MNLKAKYQYTHFIYPIIIERKKYSDFIESLLSQEKQWKFKINQQKNDESMYNFFLPYMRKFLFPTIFWRDYEIKQFKKMKWKNKVDLVSKLSCVEFEYDLQNIKMGTMDARRYGKIKFDISNIRLICFEPGICFIDIKAQIDDSSEFIEFDKILDFNHNFRSLTPRAVNRIKNKNMMHGNNINRIEDIAIFINSLVSSYETKDIEKIYYDKMFIYSYMCVHDWKKQSDFELLKNDFLKFQYVIDSANKSTYMSESKEIQDDMYSRWEYSMFGFSRESGVAFVSDEEKYNVTMLPYDFEKKYFYIMLLAFYQRLSLISFSQDLIKKDKTKIKDLNEDLTRFTHFSWFSQITNSDYGTCMWKRWKKAFELDELYEEVHKEYSEYYDSVVASGQDKINILLILLYTISVLFTGLQILTSFFNISASWVEPTVIILMIITIISYPVYASVRWLKHKFEKR